MQLGGCEATTRGRTPRRKASTAAGLPSTTRNASNGASSSARAISPSHYIPRVLRCHRRATSRAMPPGGVHPSLHSGLGSVVPPAAENADSGRLLPVRRKGGGMWKAVIRESQSLGLLPTNSRSFRNWPRMTTPEKIGSSSLRSRSDDNASHIDIRRLLDCIDYTASDSVRGDRYGPETFLDHPLRRLIGDAVAEVRRDHSW